jgi:hypothetical protein
LSRVTDRYDAHIRTRGSALSFSDHNWSASRGLRRSLATLCLAFLALFSSAAFAVDAGDIVIASTKGEVHFIVNGAERTLRAGSVLELPANIRTGRDGAVELRQGATSISVGPETVLEFPALEKAGAPIDRIVQPRGNAFYNIGKRPGRKLRVETPFLVGVVKGTQFNVAALESSTTISLFEGLLEIRSADDTDVVDLHAGEIARRDRGGSDISVLKMDGKTIPLPKAPAGGNNGAPAPSPQPAAPTSAPADVEGDVRFVEHDAAPRAVIPAPESVAEANAPAAEIVSNTPGADAPTVPEVAAAAPAVEVGAGVDLSVSTPGNVANVDLGVSTPGNGANVDVAVNTPGNAANVDVAVSTPGNGANVDLGVSTPGNGANVDVAVSAPVADAGANVDVGVTTPGGGAAVDVSVGTPAGNVVGTINLDNAASPGADVSVAVETPVAGGGASVDVSVDTPAVNVDVNAGPVNVDIGVAAPVTDAVTNVDLGLGNESNSGIALGIGTGNETGVGSGNTNDAGIGNVVDTVVDVVEEAGGLLDGLLKKPGKK